DFLLALYHSLLEHIVEHPSSRATEALAAADRLSSIVTESLSTLKPMKVSAERNDASRAAASAGLMANASLSEPRVGAKIGLQKATDLSERRAAEYAVETEDKIVFPELQRALSGVLDLAETQIYVLVD